MRGLRILVSGMIAADPYQGGATWAVLQYVLGLRALGHEVFFVEPLPSASQRPAARSLANSDNAAYFVDVAAQFGLTDHAALLLQGTHDTVGLSYAALVEVADRADVLFNVSGMLTDERLLAPIARRVYLDLDPTFIQLWHASEGIDMRFAAHTHFVTVGQAIGRPGCTVPTCGRAWIPTLPPVVLDHWPVGSPSPTGAWTTVGHWRGYGSVRHNGVFYGQKAHSLRRFFDLPGRTSEPIDLALSIDAGELADRESLRAHGWHLTDPSVVASTPDRYRQFIQQSKGELGLAKSGYVDSHCGWFSDRSACYLASGRPVVAQDTGFSRVLPTGEGLLAFTTLDEVVDALARVGRDYERHARRAREIAETHFSAELVLGRVLDMVGGHVGGNDGQGDSGFPHADIKAAAMSGR